MFQPRIQYILFEGMNGSVVSLWWGRLLFVAGSLEGVDWIVDG